MSWWNSLELFEQIVAGIAMTGSVLVLLQVLMLFFGIAGGSDIDVPDHEFDVPSGELSDFGGIRFFSLRAVLAFLTMGGWVAYYASQQGASPLLASVIGIFVGAVTGFLVAYALQQTSKLVSSGNIDYANSIGLMGSVYIPIPAKRQGRGKITLTLQERFVEIDAITDSEKPLRTGTAVRVTGKLSDDTLIVSPEF